MHKILYWCRDHIFKAIILAALSASAIAYLKGVFDTIISVTLPKGAEIACNGQEWVADHWPFYAPEAPRDKFRILIASLDGDNAKGTLTHAVVRAFHGQNAIDRVLTCRVLKIGVSQIDETAAVIIGSDWLTKHKADVLVFGEVLPRGEALNLQFLTLGPSHNFTTKAFRVETGLLRNEFEEAAAASGAAARRNQRSPVMASK
mgnify:CR=1 FL=1